MSIPKQKELIDFFDYKFFFIYKSRKEKLLSANKVYLVFYIYASVFYKKSQIKLAEVSKTSLKVSFFLK